MTDNELIAEFMGYDVYDYELFGKKVRVYSIKTNDSVTRALNQHHVNQLQYSTSWDWLMPVAIKCHEVGDAKEKECDANNTDDLDDPAGWRSWNYRRVALSTDINRVYSNVLLFIKWYNSQSSKPKIL